MNCHVQGRSDCCCHSRLPTNTLWRSCSTSRQLCKAGLPQQQSQTQQQAGCKRAHRCHKRSRVVASAAAEQLTGTELDEPQPAPRATVWQLDFSSRPILDERGKKRWELLICDEDRKFQYAQYFPNNKINSKEVRMCALLLGEVGWEVGMHEVCSAKPSA